uniref:zinc finger protein 85-like isoform X2 n=1 Tax=Myxine glutinosa TaxID=7769 RepID=UPI00358E3C06
MCSERNFYEASCSPTMYAQVGCGKDSCHVLPESQQPPVLGCKMKVEELEGSPEILQIKIEDVNSSGLEEEQSDQPNDFFVKVEVKTEHDIDAHLYLPESNDSETSFFKNHPHEGESTETTMETAPTFMSCADTCPQDSPSEINQRTFYKQDKPNEEMFAQNTFHKILKGKKGESTETTMETAPTFMSCADTCPQDSPSEINQRTFYKQDKPNEEMFAQNTFHKILKGKKGEHQYKCRNCGKSFSHSSVLQRHMTVHIGERPFKCINCGNDFKQSSHLTRHMIIHNGERPYQCTNCGKSFKQSSHLTRHMIIHNGVRPYKCTTCRKSFNHSSHLKSHMIIHNGGRPYKCTSCGKSFCLSFSLKTHMTIHNGDRPYVCTTCVKSFNQSSNFKSHVGIHNGELRPFKCTICGKYFNRSSHLKRHMVIHNGDSDIVLKHKEEKSVLVIERSVPIGFGLSASETRKMIKHQDLTNEVKITWKLKKAEIVPVIVGATGMIRKIFVDQSTCIPGKITTNELQVAAVRGSVKIQKRPLEMKL